MTIVDPMAKSTAGAGVLVLLLPIVSVEDYGVGHNRPISEVKLPQMASDSGDRLRNWLLESKSRIPGMEDGVDTPIPTPKVVPMNQNSEKRPRI